MAVVEFILEPESSDEASVIEEDDDEGDLECGGPPDSPLGS